MINLLESPIFLCFLLGFPFIISCNYQLEEPDFNMDLPYVFEDGFEVGDGDIYDLIQTDLSRWTNIQQVDSESQANEIIVSSERFTEGEQSLFIRSFPTEETLSKIDIEKGGFYAKEGTTVTIEADFYIVGSGSLAELFLIDIESCYIWDPDVPDNQCPGIRLKLGGGGDFLSIERGKIVGQTIAQNSISFPRDSWTNVRWVMTLSTEDDGLNQLFINNVELINETSANLPNPRVFTELFAGEGIEFQLQEPIGYERIQIGATANPLADQVDMFVDNFKLRIE